MFAEHGGALTASTDSIAQIHARQGYLNIHIKSCRFSHQAEPSAASHLLFLLHKDSVKLPTFSKLLHHLIKHPWVELFVSMKAHCCSLIFSSSSLSFNSSFSDLHHQLSHCSSHSSHCSLTSVLPLSMMCLIEWLESAPSSLLHRSEPAQVRYVDHHSPLHPPHSCPHLPLTVLHPPLSLTSLISSSQSLFNISKVLTLNWSFINHYVTCHL